MPLHQQMQSLHLPALDNCNICPLHHWILTLRSKLPRKDSKMMVYGNRSRRLENPAWIFVKQGLDAGVDFGVALEGLVWLVEYKVVGVYFFDDC